MFRTALRKSRWLLLFALAIFLFLGLQVLMLYGAMAGYCLWEGGGPLDFLLDGAAAAGAARFYEEYLGEILLVSQLVCLAAGFAWWYPTARRRIKPREKAQKGALWGVLPAGLGLQLTAVGLVWLQSLLWPARVEEYNEMMAQSGMGQLNWQALMATVVLAPLVEEIFCRGLMFYFALRLTGRFWAANLLQALGFAFLHLNWVQGIYAFLCGAVLGAVFGRYRRLGYCMLLHAVVNGSSILAALAQLLLPGGAGTMAAFTGFGILLLLLGLKRLDCPERPKNLGPEVSCPQDRWVWKS